MDKEHIFFAIGVVSYMPIIVRCSILKEISAIRSIIP